MHQIIGEVLDMKVKSFQEVIFPVLKLSRIFCVFPFNGNVAISPCCLLWSIIIASLLILNCTAITVKGNPRNYSSFVYFLYIFYPMLSSLCSIFSIAYSLTLRRTWKGIIAGISAVERSAQGLFQERHFDGRFIILDSWLRVLGITYFMGMVYYSFTTNMFSYISRWIGYYIPLSVVCMVEIQQITVVSYLTYCLQRIQIFDSSKIERHLELCRVLIEISKQCRKLYGWQTLFLIGTHYLLAAFDFYLFFTSIGKAQTLPSFIWLTGGRSVFRAYEIWRTVHVAGGFSKELKKFNTSLFQEALFCKTHHRITNKKVCLHLSMKHDVAFSASGIFKLDMALLHSIMASYISYISMFLQFGGRYTRF